MLKFSFVFCFIQHSKVAKFHKSKWKRWFFGFGGIYFRAGVLLGL